MADGQACVRAGCASVPAVFGVCGVPRHGRRSCARRGKPCMLRVGPPRDGIIRTSPGQECSKDKGALPGARRIFVYAARSWSAEGHAPSVWFRSWLLILHPDEERVSLYPAKRQSARSSMDRASDYGSEGWGFESLRARSGPPRCDPPVGVLHFRKHSCGSAFFISADHCGDSHDRWGSALRRVTRLAASRPTARSAAHAAPQSPVHLRYRRRNVPRVLPGKTQ